MSEGNNYLCRWDREGDGFKVWVDRRPTLSAWGETLAEALDELSGVVCLATGDGEACFELDPPASGNAAPDHFVALSGNSGWRPPAAFSLDDFDSLYEGGVCRTCCTGIGHRSQVPLPVAVFGPADLLISGLRMPSTLLASDRFRAQLTPAEQAHADWVPLDVRGKARRLFFEMRTRRPIRTVADKSKPASGWRCPACKAACYNIDYDHEYVAKADLTKFTADLLVLDNSHCLQPAIPYSRWVQIRGKAGTRGVVSSEVVAVPPSRVRRRPVLRTLTEADSRAILREFSYNSAWNG